MTCCAAQIGSVQRRRAHDHKKIIWTCNWIRHLAECERPTWLTCVYYDRLHDIAGAGQCMS